MMKPVVWWVSNYRSHRRFGGRLAHVTTSEHLGFGVYKTLCGKSRIQVDMRERVDPPSGDNFGYCKKCLKIVNGG